MSKYFLPATLTPNVKVVEGTAGADWVLAGHNPVGGFNGSIESASAFVRFTLVPEPGTLSLFGLGLILGGALHARKKKLLNGAQA